MKKKIILGLAAAGTAVAMLPLFAAFEAHVINVTAHIENALSVQREAIPFGTVFPEEHIFSEPFDIALSSSFLEQGRLDDVTYVIKQKPKCINTAGEHKPVDAITHQCPDGYVEMPLLCPYLSKEKADNDQSLETDQPPFDTELAALHGDPDNWNPEDPATQVNGKLTKLGQDLFDNWVIDLLVPCFEGQCAQDNVIPPAYQLPCDDVNHDGQCDLNGATFGCDLWVEVNGYSESDGSIQVRRIEDPDEPDIDLESLESEAFATTTYKYSVQTISTFDDSIPTVKWKITVVGPGALDLGDVHIDERGWTDVGPNPDSTTVFHYPMTDLGDDLRAIGSCASPDPEHGNGCTVDDFDVDPNDDFTNVDSIHFANDAPLGTYLIKRQLVDTETGDPLSNELVISVELVELVD